MKYWNAAIIGLVVVVIGTIVASPAGLFATTVQSEDSVDLMSNSYWTTYSSYYESAEIYDHTISMNNNRNSVGDTTDIADLIFDGQRISVDDGSEVTRDGIRVYNIRATGEWMAGDDVYPVTSYSVGIDVPEEDFQLSMTDMDVEKVAPGKRKVDFNVTVDNRWNRIVADKMYAEVWGEKVTLVNDGSIPTGENSYRVSQVFSEYDSSNFFVERNITRTAQVVIQNPSIPADQKRIYGDKGSKTPNFNLKDIETDKKQFQVNLQYCGENASYSSGECEIEDDLHLRGDVTPLLDRHQIVTETFGPGTYSLQNLEPEPVFFSTKYPVLATNPKGETTDKITEPYQKMVDGETFTVPESQTYTLFWTINTNEVETSVICEKGTLNQSTGECEVNPGVVHKCSQGVWSPEEGACTVTPEVKNICQEGRYNSELGVCVYEPEVKEQCPTGATLGDNGMCYEQADVQKVCPAGVDGTIEDGLCQTEAHVYAQNSVISSAQQLVDSTIWTIQDFFSKLIPF